MKKAISVLVLFSGLFIHSSNAWSYDDDEIMMLGSQMCERDYNWLRGEYWNCGEARSWLKEVLSENCEESDGRIRNWRTSYENVGDAKLVTVSGRCRR